MKSAVSIIAHFLYKLVYYFIYLVLLAFLIVSPIDLIRQAIITKQNYSILIVALCYLVTILIVVFIYATRLYYNKAVLDSIPKSWIPIEKGDVPRDVRQLVVAGLSRSAAIAYEARPRLPALPSLLGGGPASVPTTANAPHAATSRRQEVDQRNDNEGQEDGADSPHESWLATAAKEASKEAADRFTGQKRSRWKPKVRRGISADTMEGRESTNNDHNSTRRASGHGHPGDDHQTVSINIAAPLPPRGGPHIWGEIEHPGWASPTSPDLANVQYDTVICELPNLIEAKAITLAPPDRMTSEQGGEGGEAGRMMMDQPPLLDPDAVALLQRHESMGLREYLTSLTELGVVAPSEALSEFIKLYERARYSTRPVSIDEFRRLMHVFAEVLRGMRPLDPVILDEIVGGGGGEEEYEDGDDDDGAEEGNYDPEENAHNANDGTEEGDGSNNDRRFSSPYSHQGHQQGQPSPRSFYESDIDNDAPRRSYSSGDLRSVHRRDSGSANGSVYRGENELEHYFASRQHHQHQPPPRTPTPKTPTKRRRKKGKYTTTNTTTSSSATGPSPSTIRRGGPDHNHHQTSVLTRQQTNSTYHSSSSSSLRSANTPGNYLRPETAKTAKTHLSRSANRNSSGTYSSTIYSWQQQQRQFRTAPTTPVSRSGVAAGVNTGTGMGMGLYRAGTNATHGTNEETRGSGAGSGMMSKLSLASSSGGAGSRGVRSVRSERSLRSAMSMKSGGSGASNGSSGSRGSVIRLAGAGDRTDLPYVLMPAASI